MTLQDHILPITGKRRHSICNGACYTYSSLIDIDIPNSVTNIGDNAFEGFSSLNNYCPTFCLRVVRVFFVL